MDVNNPLKMVLIGIDPYPIVYKVTNNGMSQIEHVNFVKKKKGHSFQDPQTSIKIGWSGIPTCLHVALGSFEGFTTNPDAFLGYERRSHESYSSFCATEEDSSYHKKLATLR